jgi:hypothetical protein
LSADDLEAGRRRHQLDEVPRLRQHRVDPLVRRERQRGVRLAGDDAHHLPVLLGVVRRLHRRHDDVLLAPAPRAGTSPPRGGRTAARLSGPACTCGPRSPAPAGPRTPACPSGRRRSPSSPRARRPRSARPPRSRPPPPRRPPSPSCRSRRQQRHRRVVRLGDHRVEPRDSRSRRVRVRRHHIVPRPRVDRQQQRRVVARVAYSRLYWYTVTGWFERSRYAPSATTLLGPLPLVSSGTHGSVSATTLFGATTNSFTAFARGSP